MCCCDRAVSTGPFDHVYDTVGRTKLFLFSNRGLACHHHSAVLRGCQGLVGGCSPL